MENETTLLKNPLESESIGKLILKYSLPAIVSSLVSSIYNIVDQIFVGNSVGELGNAATNVAFPLVMIITTLAMIFGVGGASAFSLYQGQKEIDKVKSVVGNSLTLMVISGIIVAIISVIFLRPLLIFFGGRDQTLEYSIEYTRIIAIGTPLAILGTGAGQLIRADGSPKYAMIATLVGAILNCILDPIFIFGFNMGMSGAAYATVSGQLISAILLLIYFRRFKTCKLTKQDYLLKYDNVSRIFELGLASGASQLAITVTHIIMNNTVGYYGELSQYGRDIPLACIGIIMKITTIFNSTIYGISQSTQPIIGYNYGAENYTRVKTTLKKAAIIVTCISFIAFLCFQLFPYQIISIFGPGDDLYYEFAVRYFHIYLSCTFIAGLQILASNFFPSIGKGRTGTVVALSRQFFILIPLILIFPLFFGINGILFAGPIADASSGILSVILLIHEIKKW